MILNLKKSTSRTLEADVVTLALEYDVNAVRDAGLIEDGWVSVVIGTILQPTKHKVRGEYRKRKRRVRWNCFGVCMNANGTSNGDLYNFNISL